MRRTDTYSGAMETVIVAGIFALLGAVLGTVLTGIMQRLTREQTAQAERLDSAIRSVAVRPK